VNAGVNFIDTADVYSRWVDGNPGGVAEQIVGNWLAARSVRRDEVILATKVRGRMGKTFPVGRRYTEFPAKELLELAHTQGEISAPPELWPVHADPSQMHQVLVNLCVNARDAMPRGGRLLIETRNVEFDEKYCRRYVYARPGRYVLLSVSDTGVGMDAATIERIFEPFFTTKEMGKGTGLGLAVVYGIAKQHGGFINVYSEPGQGTTFRVYLPVGNEVAEEREKTATEPVRGGTETILVAEDHEGLRDMARKMLERLGYQVVLAGDGEEAVRMFEEHRDRIALVILDVVLPKLSGPEAYARMCALKPDVSVVFATGYTAEAAQLNSMLEKGAAVLQKPYSPDSLARKVRDILDHARQR